jgi:hypothetical protein
VTSNRREKRLNIFSHSLAEQLSGGDRTRKMRALLQTTMQPVETGEPWIDAEDVARRVSQRRKRRCLVQEVTAALHGDSVPASDIVSAAIELRAEWRRADVQSAAQRRHHAEDQELVLQALSRQEISDKARPHRVKSVANIFRKKTAWAIGVVTAAILTLLATGVVPSILGQFFNGSAVEDKLRSGPAIVIADESRVYTNGPDVPDTTVIPGNYNPSSALIRALSRPMGAVSPIFLNEEHTYGVPVGQIYIRVILQGNRNEPIRILDIQPAQLQRRPPLGGVYFDIGGQGAEEDLQIGFNLDQPAPQAVNVMKNSPTLLEELYFQTHTISLRKGEQLALLILAQTSCYDAEFNLAINYIVGATKSTEIISNHGHSFQVTGARSNFMSYRRVFALQGNYSVAGLSPVEIAKNYHQTGKEVGCQS